MLIYTLGFVLWEARSAHPMLDLRFFRNPRFSAAGAAVTLVNFAFVGTLFLLTQFLQFVLGYTPLQAGIRMLPAVIGIMVMAPLSARRLADMVLLCARVAAIEFVVAAQAIDLRAPGELGLGSGRAYRMIRELIPFMQADGTLPADLEPVVELVTRGVLNQPTPAA